MAAGLAFVEAQTTGRKGRTMGLRDDAVAARAAELAVRYEEARRCRRAELDMLEAAMSERFRAAFGVAPDTVDPERCTATADGITLEWTHTWEQPNYWWWQKRWMCPKCGAHDRRIVDDLPSLGAAILAQEELARQHADCPPPEDCEED